MPTFYSQYTPSARSSKLILFGNLMSMAIKKTHNDVLHSPHHHHPHPQNLSTHGTETPPAADMDTAKRLNIRCDKLTAEAATKVMQGTYPAITPISPPYPGTKALLQIGNLWITSHVPRHISLACHTNNAREYCMKKYHRSESTFNSVYWDGIECTCKCGTKTQLMHTSKIMHGWLPVMHMVGPITNLTQCLGCHCPDETLDHLFHCPHPKMHATSAERLVALENCLKKFHLPHAFTLPFITFLQAYLEDSPVPDIHSPLAQEVFQSQAEIGQGFVIRGFISTKWLHLLKYIGHD
jgi:hypothetical protein